MGIKDGFFKSRYETEEGNWLLIRPDHYIAARGEVANEKIILAALERSIVPSHPTRIGSLANTDKYAWDKNYRHLIAAHKGKNKTESNDLNIKLLLGLMQYVDDPKIFEQLIRDLKNEKT